MDQTLGGKELQARAAATENARSPRLDRWVDGTTSVNILADLICDECPLWWISEVSDQNTVLFGQSHYVYLHNSCRLPRCLVAMETLQLVRDPY